MYSTLYGKLLIYNKKLEILYYTLLIAFSYLIEFLENSNYHFEADGFYYFS